ncbi:Mobile element protein [Lutibaculum baratangense AMV1]|uniref:Mobile element protein n=1 Tax=Lutibaculum baratangense AMV1 TaxID=631454 RepID=V4RKN6_9HYPH|nr:integrase core domain-containing protein [Lutibaculum baratangense]ESR26621.1 Mobile element protein [Lutibaculum baratangense AMV1]
MSTKNRPLIQPENAELDRHGLVSQARRRNRAKAGGTPLTQAVRPNDLWCADFKGEFKLGNGRYCYPLTVTDQASRYLLLAEALESVREAPVIEAFARLFRDRGLPHGIRSDNGVPFASPNGLYNLSRLSVWWLRLGITIERIEPGHPQQNGRHERMHLTLKKEATRPPGVNILQQQARSDAFLSEFNEERPHEALAMKTPAEIHSPSSRPCQGLPELTYPLHDKDIMVTACGRICMMKKKINVSTVLAGQRLGIKEVDDGIWLVSFMRYDLRYIETCRESDRDPTYNPSPLTAPRPNRSYIRASLVAKAVAAFRRGSRARHFSSWSNSSLKTACSAGARSSPTRR